MESSTLIVFIIGLQIGQWLELWLLIHMIESARSNSKKQ